MQKIQKKMAYVLRSVLPEYIIDIIKEYTGDGCWRNGKYINIRRIPKDDPRYQMLKKRPKIKQLRYDTVGDLKAGCVWFKLPNNKFVVINVLRGRHWIGDHRIEGDFWELSYNGEKIIRLV
jgi:hypothetical protein